MPQTMAGQLGRQVRAISGGGEERLDLTLAQWATAAREDRRSGITGGGGEVGAQERCGLGEERPFTPRTAFQPTNDDPTALEVHIGGAQQRHLAYPQSVEVDQRKEGLIPKIGERAEEGADLFLRQVARKGLDVAGGVEQMQRWINAGWRSTTPFRRKAQWAN